MSRLTRALAGLTALGKARIVLSGLLGLALAACAVLLVLDLPVRIAAVVTLGLVLAWGILAGMSALVRRTPQSGVSPRDEVESFDRPGGQHEGVIARVARSANVGMIVIFGLSTKSYWMRRVLAHEVTSGREQYERLVDLFVEYAAAPEPKAMRVMLRDFEAAPLIQLSRLIYGQQLRPDDDQVSLAMIEYVVTRQAFSRVPENLQQYCAWRLLVSGQPGNALQVVERWQHPGPNGERLRADVLNPFQPNALQFSEALWLEAFNRDFIRVGLEPISLKPEGPSVFDRLECVAPATHGGPKVSVIMTTFRPDHTLATAVRSVVAQTWQNWELLIIDDGSGAEFDAILGEMEALDPRITLVRSEANAGTYRRRNDGLRLATGEFVTFHDSDDWAHPRRLEVQIQLLVSDPDRLASSCDSVRISEDLVFSQRRGLGIRKAEVSILFRREVVLDRLGGFDWVRKGGDSEFRWRLEAAFGVTIPVAVPGTPLHLARYTSDSLSASDISPGFVHPSRRAYRSAFTRWHEEIRTGSTTAIVPLDPPERAFPAPTRLTGLPGVRQHWDHLVVLDGSEGSWSAKDERLVVAYLASLTGSVAILPVRSPTRGLDRRELLAPAFQDLLAKGRIDVAFVDQDAQVDRVTVLRASDLQAAAGVPSRIAATSVVVTTGPDDVPDDTYSVADVEEQAVHLFGTAPRWVSAGTSEAWR